MGLGVCASLVGESGGVSSPRKLLMCLQRIWGRLKVRVAAGITP